MTRNEACDCSGGNFDAPISVTLSAVPPSGGCVLAPQKPLRQVHVRWMIRADMPEVLAIENGSFEFPWSEEDFVRCLRQRNCIGLVAECMTTERILGFVVYELHRNRLHIINLAVAAGLRKQQVGRQIMDKLKAKLSPVRRNRIMAEVRESNLSAQLFFKAEGFRAISVLRDFYDEQDTTEDAYLFQFRCQGPVIE